MAATMASPEMIRGVRKIPLARHADDRGYLTEVLRSDDPHFVRFGQVYVTMRRKGLITAWHAHRLQTDAFYVAKGTCKVGLYDDREDSPTRERYMQVILGEEGEETLLVIPPGVWHGHMPLSETAHLINVVSETYNPEAPDELRRPVDDLEDIWTVRGR
jgi:dTDP-4-dehydrorhamnose 3,5-epimerase